MKKFLSLILVTAILFSACFTGMFNITSSAATSGYYTYSVSNGEATITDCKTSISGNVIIPSTIGGYSVKGIESFAFRLCDEITSITIPDSIKSIGNYAFEGCESLTKVNITDLGAWCNIEFADYYSNPLEYANELYINDVLITDIIIPDSVTKIGDFVFYSCESIESITISDNVESIGINAFAGCTSLKKVNITDLGAWCNIDFSGSYSNPLKYANKLYINDILITDITIPNNVTSINSYAFTNCKSLKNITIPDNVTRIGSSVFSDCDSLESITIPFVDMSLTDTTNASLKYIFGEYSSVPASLKNVVITKETVISKYAFSGCTGLESIVIPNTVTSIDSDAFGFCPNLRSIIIDSQNENFTSDDGVLFDKQKIKLICYPLGKREIDNCYSIPNSVIYIDDNAFSDCKSLESIIIPNSVKHIGDRAFSGCTNLESIAIPNSVTIISPYTFSFCSSLKDVKIPNSINSIGNNAFEYCKSLEAITIPDSVKSMGIKAFTYCEGLKAITIPNSITSISSCLFYNCKNLESIIIPDSITNIGYNAFGNCSSLESITIPFVGENFDGTSNTHFGYIFGAGSYETNDDIPSLLKNVIITKETSIKSNAFRNCKNIKRITIPDSVTSISNDAFYFCTNLEGIEVDSQNKNFTSVDGVLFDKQKTALICYPLAMGKINTSYSVPDGVTSIGPYTFYNCSSLESISIPNSVTDIGKQAFYNCRGLESVIIPDSVTSIGKQAFCECTKLKDVTIPQSVKEIGEYAFEFCENLAKVNITDIAAWCNIDFEGNIFANPLYYAENLYLNNILVDDITIPDGVTSIGEQAFYNCKSLRSVIIGDDVTSINSNAFSNCTGLNSVIIGNRVESIDEYAFYNCKNLESIIIPNSVTSINYGAFIDCTGLDSVIIGNRLEIIGADAFVNCDNLRSITIPNSVAKIGSFAFGTCTNLTNVYYCGTEENWNNIFINSGNSYLTSATKYYHDFGDWQQKTEPTCSVKGEKYRICSICGDKQTEVISAIEHTWQKATCTNPKTCKICGKTEGNPLGHTGGTATCENKAICSRCNKEYGDYATHTYKTTTTKATLSKNGSIVKKCTVCGDVASKSTIRYVKTIKLSNTSYTYNGKTKTPTVTVKNSAGTTLKKNTHYTVTYSSGRKNVGTYKVTIKMKGNYSGTKTYTFTIKPRAASVNSLTAKSKALIVKLNRSLKQSTGYQIQYSTSKTFKNAKTKVVPSYKTSSVTLSKLSAKKTYYVRVRTYKSINGKKYYSNWSSYKYKKTK